MRCSKIAQQKKVDLAKGEREKYFNDDDMSLDEMVYRDALIGERKVSGCGSCLQIAN